MLLQLFVYSAGEGLIVNTSLCEWPYPELPIIGDSVDIEALEKSGFKLNFRSDALKEQHFKNMRATVKSREFTMTTDGKPFLFMYLYLD